MSDSYDVAVVGGGLGGLSAAAALARAGRKVILLERAPGLGGCAAAFKRGEYTFDPAVHYLGAVAGEGAFVDILMRVLGVRDQVNFIPFDSIYGVDMPGLRLKMPLGIENFIEVHKEAFPGQADGIGEFLQACVQMTAESQAMPPRVNLRDLDAAAKQFPLLFRYRKATVDDVLDEYVDDPKVRSLITAAWPYVGLPPSKLSFVTFCAMLMYVIEGGPHYCEGSFQSLVNAFATSIENSGGEIHVNTGVSKIIVRDGVAHGVVTDEGLQIGAPLVIANADAKVVMEDLVGVEHLPPRYVRRLQRMTPSLSGFWLFAATSMDVTQSGLPHEIFIHHHWDHDENLNDILAGKPGGMWLSLPSIFDDTLAPAGEHVVILTSHMPYDIGEPWHDAKPRVEEQMIGEVERILPGFRDSLTHVESATPDTFERWTGNHEGAIYGWESIPNQSTPKRLPRITPIDGLMLSSAWTEPGAGAVRTMYSGFQTAQIVLGYETGDELMQALGQGAAH